MIPNPTVLVNTIILQEAKDSSTIENIVTTTDKLYRALASPKNNIDSATKEVLRYREALWTTYNQLKSGTSFDKSVVVKIFQTITTLTETFRARQVYIGSEAAVVYTPPAPHKIAEKIDNWFDFALQQNSIDPLIKLAVLHYQFEAIHPFTDGNGRTGRILNALLLCHYHLLDLPILYLSKYILENKGDYYRLLREVTENQNWHEWILYMLESIEQTALYTLQKVNAIFELFSQVRESVEKNAPEIYSYELIELLFSQPYCKIAFLVEKNIASRNTASKYLNKLTEMKILQPHQEGTENIYIHTDLYKILSR